MVPLHAGEVELALAVELLQSEPVLCVELRLPQGRDDAVLAEGVEAELAGGGGDDGGVLLPLRQHQHIQSCQR